MTGLAALRGALKDLEVLDDRPSRSVTENVARDAVLGRQVGSGRRPPLYRIWENGRSLVTTARESRLPSFGEAAETLTSEGWPVVERESGGTAVPHGPGILQASLLIPQTRVQAHALEAIYEALCLPARVALAELGIDTGFGDVAGSFCDGRFNLVAGGRKIAGTSQRWRGGIPPSHRPGGYVLAHMVLFIEADMTRATEAVNRLYALSGAPERFDPAAVVSASEHLGPAGTHRGPGRLTDRVGHSMASAATGLGAAAHAHVDPAAP